MLWVKAFHVIFMVTWFAGLFYLPRLFVYHALADDAVSRERFLFLVCFFYYGIMSPGAELSVALGEWMLIDYAWAVFFRSGWLHAK